LDVWGNGTDGPLSVSTSTAGTPRAIAVNTSGNTTMSGTLGVTGAITAPTLDTGQGANELYDMDQNVQTTDAPTFATVNTGQGANELYDMNQNVQTGDSVTFAGVTNSALTNTRVTYAGASGVLTDDADMTFNGTTLTVSGLAVNGFTTASTVTLSGGPLNEAQGTDVASAATLNLNAVTGNLIDVTGTTGITAITLSQGLERTVRFTGALTLTHGASLVLPTAANITTVAGDFAIFRGYATGVVRCVVYSRADGTAIAGGSTAASQAEQETGSATTVFVSPGRQHYHTSAAKAWALVTSTGTVAVLASYNVSSVTDNGTGDLTFNWTNAFSSVNYVCVGSARGEGGDGVAMNQDSTTAPTTSAYRVQLKRFVASADVDSELIYIVCYGDQ
jgi:hypothetical protein